MSESRPFVVSPPGRTVFGWLFGAIALWGIGLFPWIAVVLQADRLPSIPQVLICTAWTLMPGSLATFLTFSAVCKGELTARDGMLVRVDSWLGFTRRRRYEFGTAYCVTFRHHGGSSSRKDRSTIFLQYEGRFTRLISDLECSDFEELVEWIPVASGLECHDLRDRGPIIRPQQILSDDAW